MPQESAKVQIAAAFMKMVEEQGIEAVRVNDLISQAGVSRATFYRHFHDKYDVMNWTYRRAVDPVVLQQPQLTHERSWSLASFSYIREHKKFFRSIISYRGQNSFYDFMAAYFAENIRRAVREKEGEAALTEKMEFTIEMRGHIGALAIKKWILSNCEMDEEKLMDFIREFNPDSLRPFYQEEA